MSPLEPQSAADYDDRSTEAVKSVLLEIGQILGSYKGKFVVVGGLIPWLLQNDEDMPHVGSLDIDLGLDPSAPTNCLFTQAKYIPASSCRTFTTCSVESS